ncbi:PREDICTED: gastrin-releasing peptide, partial [Elephantulus edwardii]|uniref:gastrin-releasing peptide n=1 Tax=Elephantulus edwardii TaxID=28737 RepID=UPI0003F072A4
MCGRELPLVLLALVLCPAPRGHTASASDAGGPVLPKMYPRGNHWAVGHLMGKKSTAESLYVGERSREQPPRGLLTWEEAARNVLRLVNVKPQVHRSTRPPPRLRRNHHLPTQDAEDSSTFEDTGSNVK